MFDVNASVSRAPTISATRCCAASNRRRTSAATSPPPAGSSRNELLRCALQFRIAHAPAFAVRQRAAKRAHLAAADSTRSSRSRSRRSFFNITPQSNARELVACRCAMLCCAIASARRPRSAPAAGIAPTARDVFRSRVRSSSSCASARFVLPLRLDHHRVGQERAACVANCFARGFSGSAGAKPTHERHQRRCRASPSRAARSRAAAAPRPASGRSGKRRFVFSDSGRVAPRRRRSRRRCDRIAPSAARSSSRPGNTARARARPAFAELGAIPLIADQPLEHIRERRRCRRGGASKPVAQCTTASGMPATQWRRRRAPTPSLRE